MKNAHLCALSHCMIRHAIGFATAALLLLGTVSPALAADPRVKLSTSAGDIVLELDAAKAPKTVENFLHYVRDKHYDGTVFHRVINGFMVQGGGFTADLQEKPARPPVAFETTGLKNDKYTVAMARTRNPNSATAQFFINVQDNAILNPPGTDGYGYVVFGKVVSGTEVVDKIRAVSTSTRGPYQNVPTTPVTITSAVVL